MQSLIRRNDSHQRYFLKIQALCNHLGAQQNFRLSAPEFFQQLKVGIFSPRGILVHPQELNTGKFLPDDLFQPLGTHPAV